MIKTANNFDTFHASRTGPYNFQFNFITGTRGRVRASIPLVRSSLIVSFQLMRIYIYIYACILSVSVKKIQIYRFISAIPLSNEYLRRHSLPAPLHNLQGKINIFPFNSFPVWTILTKFKNYCISLCRSTII